MRLMDKWVTLLTAKKDIMKFFLEASTIKIQHKFKDLELNARKLE